MKTIAGKEHPGSFLVSGIETLWSQTRGDDRICVAVLDGPVDRSHETLRGANLQLLEGPAPGWPDAGPACRHGTHVTSVIFGRHDSPVAGMAPDCRGVVVPIFESVDETAFRACSQLDLGRALTTAVLAGANVINISGGQFAPGGAAHPLLSAIVQRCAEQGVLLVAAAGNEGCECLQVPAALENVLAVGAMDRLGQPLPFSNWGSAYRTQGILAPGEDVPGAVPGGGLEQATGTSYATAVVSGIAALLLSLQLRRGEVPSPRAVRAALLAGARRRNGTARDARYLAGRLDIRETVSILFRGRSPMPELPDSQANNQSENHHDSGASAVLAAPFRFPELKERAEQPAASEPPRVAPRPTETKAKTCGCGAAAGTPPLVYALGQIGYDFPSEARLDSIVQKMAAEARMRPERALAYDPHLLLTYLTKYPWDAASIEWTLSVESTVLYAIRPRGPFAADGYAELRRLLRERFEEGTERISVPGVVAGQATLLSGQRVPVIVPELRGMYSWTTAALVDAVVGPASPVAPAAEQDGQARRREGVRNFLARVYHEVRNLGLTPQDRALNFAATNAFEMGVIFSDAIQERMELDQVKVSPSPVARPDSDCWDVEVYFFYPERQVQTVRKVYRFTVDVSDNVPVTVGTMRSWFTR